MDTAARLRILLVDDMPERLAVLKDALTRAGCTVAGVATPGDDLSRVVREHQPDVIIIDVDSPSRDTLESLRAINRDLPRPIVMFVDHSDSRAIEEAMKAGVSAYVIDGLNAQRVKPIIDVAIARFKEYQTLRSELERTKSSLQDRKIIDRAKGILMEQRRISEDEAYRALRRLAMEQNRRLVDVAQQLIAFAQVLKP
jgi:two-component system, response regulator / RNA-binding antiterminator